jgi:hypothetical protein
MKLFRAFSNFQEKLSSLNLPTKKIPNPKIIKKKNRKKREAGRTNNSFIMWK